MGLTLPDSSPVSYKALAADIPLSDPEVLLLGDEDRLPAALRGLEGSGRSRAVLEAHRPSGEGSGGRNLSGDRSVAAMIGGDQADGGGAGDQRR